MKKSVVLFCTAWLFMTLSPFVFGGEWGGFANLDEPIEDAIQQTKSKMDHLGLFPVSSSGPNLSKFLASEHWTVRKDIFLLNHIIAGKPIRIFFTTPKNISERTKKEYRKMIKKAYKTWTAAPLQAIKAQKREKEFADILPILRREVDVRFAQNPSQIDIFFAAIDPAAIPARCGKDAIACYCDLMTYGRCLKPTIFIPLDNLESAPSSSFNYSLLLHEIGHSLGLSDQYLEGRRNTHPQYSSVYTAPGVMNFSANITYDDMDGIINLIDILQKRPSARNTNSWHSLDPELNEYYSYGKPLHWEEKRKTMKIDGYEIEEVPCTKNENAICAYKLITRYARSNKIYKETFPLTTIKGNGLDYFMEKDFIFPDTDYEPAFNADSCLLYRDHYVSSRSVKSIIVRDGRTLAHIFSYIDGSQYHREMQANTSQGEITISATYDPQRPEDGDLFYYSPFLTIELRQDPIMKSFVHTVSSGAKRTPSMEERTLILKTLQNWFQNFIEYSEDQIGLKEAFE